MTSLESLITIAISAAPVAELRGGLPYALARGATPVVAFVLAVAGNLVVVPILLFGLRTAERVLRRWQLTARLMEHVFARTRRKGKWVDRFGLLGLFLLVAIPLPGTGAWTGAIAAVLLGVPIKRAFAVIALGVLAAGVLVLFASLGAFELLGVA